LLAASCKRISSEVLKPESRSLRNTGSKLSDIFQSSLKSFLNELSVLTDRTNCRVSVHELHGLLCGCSAIAQQPLDDSVIECATLPCRITSGIDFIAFVLLAKTQ